MAEDNPEQPEPAKEVAKLQKIEDVIEEITPEIFTGLSAQKKQDIIRTVQTLTVISRSKTHIGPLPDGETLREYNELIPNGADRVMVMAERQSEHRMTMEKTVIEGQTKQSSRGQSYALIIGLFALAGSTACILLGHEWPGTVLGVGGLTGLVTAFIVGKDKQSENLHTKRED